MQLKVVLILLVLALLCSACLSDDMYKECDLNDFPADSLIYLKKLDKNLKSYDVVDYLQGENAEKGNIKTVKILANTDITLETTFRTIDDSAYCRVRAYNKNGISLYWADYEFESQKLIASHIDYANNMEEHHDKDIPEDIYWLFVKHTKVHFLKGKKTKTKNFKKYRVEITDLSSNQLGNYNIKMGYEVVVHYDDELIKQFIFSESQPYYLSEKIFSKDIFDNDKLNLDYITVIKSAK